ncbi:MAG: hypothetical protein JRI97_08905, partial [Deltaproteobacteria bacterium]|nr:hypothetical protein [Deltaproteobacteria bacterium]
MVEKAWYQCDTCGAKKEAEPGGTAPICCDVPMKPLPLEVCRTMETAEQYRFG